MLVWFWHLHFVISIVIGFGKILPLIKRNGTRLICWHLFINLATAYHLSGRISAIQKKRPGDRPVFCKGYTPQRQKARLRPVNPDGPLTVGSFCLLRKDGHDDEQFDNCDHAFSASLKSWRLSLLRLLMPRQVNYQ